MVYKRVPQKPMTEGPETRLDFPKHLLAGVDYGSLARPRVTEPKQELRWKVLVILEDLGPTGP